MGLQPLQGPGAGGWDVNTHTNRRGDVAGDKYDKRRRQQRYNAVNCYEQFVS